MFQCPQQCLDVQESSAPATEQAEWERVGAVWYVVLLSSRHHCLHMPCPTRLWGQLCASPSAGDMTSHCQLAAAEGESKGCEAGPARRKKWA